MGSGSEYIPKSKIAYEHIKKGILYGHYGVGGKIGISKVAKELKVSGIPVREALRQLELEGFVQNIPHVGFEVTVPEFDDFVELHDVREILAAEAIRRAVKTINNVTLNILKDKISRIWKEIDNKNFVEINKLNHEFHNNLFFECKNKYFSQFICQINSMSRARSIYTLYPSVENSKIANMEHENIYEAIKDGDPERTVNEYLKHKERSLKLLLKLNSINKH